MLRKTKLGFIIISIILLAFSASAFAQDNNYEINSIERQMERLHELKELINSPDFARTVPLNANGEPLEIPNINLIAPPDRNGHFMIGLEIDHTGLVYEDCEAMRELTRQEVPSEIVDFIISFAGIEKDQVKIGYGIFLPTLRLPHDYVVTGTCPVWGDDRSSIRNDEIYTENYINLQMPPPITLRIGQLDHISFLGPGTIGHPRNSNGRIYTTAVHGDARVGTIVDTNSFPRNEIGHISRMVFHESVDIAEVTLNSNVHLSMALPGSWNWPGGINITNFRGVPRGNDNVRSIRGMSGVQESRIHAVGASTDRAINKILIYPNGATQVGDSGAALIRVSDSAVLGTRQGRFTTFGTVFGVYSNVQRY